MQAVDASSAVSWLIEDVIRLFIVPPLDSLFRFVFVFEVGIPIDILAHVPIGTDAFSVLCGAMSTFATAGPIGS